MKNIFLTLLFLTSCSKVQTPHKPLVGDIYKVDWVNTNNGCNNCGVGIYSIISIQGDKVYSHDYYLTPNGTSWGYIDKWPLTNFYKADMVYLHHFNSPINEWNFK